MEQNMTTDHQPPHQRRLKPPPENPSNHHPPPPPQKCPRCDSANTKFCYYNNYSLSQPRYFCKGCRRYWTQGGTLRNVPVGGGCRRGKRPKPSSSSTIAKTQSLSTAAPLPSTQQSFTGMGMISGQSLRPDLSQQMGGNTSFYAGGPILSPLAAMQSLPAGINQSRGTQFDLLQNDFYPPQQNLFPQRPLSSWTQSFINRGPCFWGGATGGNGGDQVGSSSSSLNPNPNQWSSSLSDNHPGFNPSQ
ncbi:hypothetical protein ACJIZ3_013215 [Penstemon smallii]|uniref:Dof zinc finger protein n=1 Tax=Penstemon smallii TaxID=265156 RepID=A0ABD3US50_9LAMI